MAVDRYRALSRNYRPSSRKGPPKIAHAIAGLVWLCAFSFSMPVFMRATIIGEGEATHCFEQWDDYQYLGLDELKLYGPRPSQLGWFMGLVSIMVARTGPKIRTGSVSPDQIRTGPIG